MAASKSDLEKELERWKQKYELARTFLELQRKLERGENLPGEEDPAGGKRQGIAIGQCILASYGSPGRLTHADHHEHLICGATLPLGSSNQLIWLNIFLATIEDGLN